MVSLFCSRFGNREGWRSRTMGATLALFYFKYVRADRKSKARPFGFAQGRLCRRRRDKDGAPSELLPVYEFGEHALGVDGDEKAFAAGQDFVVFVEDLGHVDVLAAFDSYFAGFDS